jgi:hypothetical protein
VLVPSCYVDDETLFVFLGRALRLVKNKAVPLLFSMMASWWLIFGEAMQTSQLCDIASEIQCQWFIQQRKASRPFAWQCLLTGGYRETLSSRITL